MSDGLGLDDLTSEQVAGVDRLFEFDRTVMVAAMGFGKTVVGLTAISELLGAGEAGADRCASEGMRGVGAGAGFVGPLAGA